MNCCWCITLSVAAADVDTTVDVDADTEWCWVNVIGLCVVLLRLNLETWWQSIYAKGHRHYRNVYVCLCPSAHTYCLDGSAPDYFSICAAKPQKTKYY